MNCPLLRHDDSYSILMMAYRAAKSRTRWWACKAATLLHIKNPTVLYIIAYKNDDFHLTTIKGFSIAIIIHVPDLTSFKRPPLFIHKAWSFPRCKICTKKSDIYTFTHNNANNFIQISNVMSSHDLDCSHPFWLRSTMTQNSLFWIQCTFQPFYSFRLCCSD